MLIVAVSMTRDRRAGFSNSTRCRTLDRIWAVVNREEANRRGGKKQQGKFLETVMVWLAVCSEGVAPLVLFEKGILNNHCYIKKVLPVALRYGNSKFGNNWTFQQDNGIAHTPQKMQD